MALPAIGGLVTSIWTALQPFLPIIATKAAEEAGKQLPAAIGRLWASIRKRSEAKPSAKEAVEDLLKAPTDADTQAAFRIQLKKLIEEDKGFHEELVKALKEAETEGGIHVHQTGSGAVAIGSGANAVGAGSEVESSATW